jgi:hypothetical protein
MTVSPRWRKALLTAHVVTAVGWLGADAVQLTLGVAGLTGADPAVAYPALGLVGTKLFVPLSVLVWLIGVVSAALTPWGLFRHRWVAVKLALTTAMLGAVVFALRPNLTAARDLGAAVPMDVRIDLVAAASVSTTLLIVATVLSTYKPWGRTPSRRGVRRRRADRVRAQMPGSGRSGYLFRLPGTALDMPLDFRHFVSAVKQAPPGSDGGGLAPREDRTA